MVTSDIALGEPSHLKLLFGPEDNISGYNIYRETKQYNIFEKIGTVNPGPGQFIDSASSPDIRSYRYKISATDLCGGESQFSTPHKSMHLTVNEGHNGTVNLIWEPYEGFNYSTFKIWRP